MIFRTTSGSDAFVGTGPPDDGAVAFAVSCQQSRFPPVEVVDLAHCGKLLSGQKGFEGGA
jgi:hypothetical protein